MSDLAKELGAGSLTEDQVNAITHAWLDLRASKEHFEGEDEFVGVGADELATVCTDSIEELETAFPFLLRCASIGNPFIGLGGVKDV